MRYIIWIFISFLPFNLSSQNSLEIGKDSLIKVQLSTALIGESVEVTAKIINGNIILEGDIFLLSSSFETILSLALLASFRFPFKVRSQYLSKILNLYGPA